MAGTDAEHPAAAKPLPCRILVVDDFAVAAESLAKWLRQLGHKVKTATDGKKAIKAAESFVPHVILLDIIMPEIDGYEVARRIRQQPWGKHMRLVALTALSAGEDRQRSREAGFDAHLVKPAYHSDLTALLDSLSRRKMPNRQI